MRKEGFDNSENGRGAMPQIRGERKSDAKLRSKLNSPGERFAETQVGTSQRPRRSSRGDPPSQTTGAEHEQPPLRYELDYSGTEVVGGTSLAKMRSSSSSSREKLNDAVPAAGRLDFFLSSSSGPKSPLVIECSHDHDNASTASSSNTTAASSSDLEGLDFCPSAAQSRASFVSVPSVDSEIFTEMLPSHERFLPLATEPSVGGKGPSQGRPDEKNGYTHDSDMFFSADDGNGSRTSTSVSGSSSNSGDRSEFSFHSLEELTSKVSEAFGNMSLHKTFTCLYESTPLRCTGAPVPLRTGVS